jgi:hypothetical protein
MGTKVIILFKWIQALEAKLSTQTEKQQKQVEQLEVNFLDVFH